MTLVSLLATYSTKINRTTVQISYQVNTQHAKGSGKAKISKTGSAPLPPPGCNCRGRPPGCPLDVACLTEELVYKATIVRTDPNHVETYTGLTGGTFKARHNNHQSDFRNVQHGHSTTPQPCGDLRWPDSSPTLIGATFKNDKKKYRKNMKKKLN